MKAKEKAIELVRRFRMYDIQICDLMGSELKGYEEEHYKQCALICLDVILNDVGAKDWELDTGTNTNYWQEVKEEINKL